ncbi:MAG: CRR6 family NdhI maturation factor [Spirulinaceae cyanobacterium RM2_2_10]|nr:CRR6 family NdhI maturation factor [Spirulinaceae cyanobacterium SM2_1_0]NJO19125.1 CRR6 family NdhI maturation factor [Spirulinaceae cyanobacterium RM2_2_10]
MSKSLAIALNAEQIHRLDLSAATMAIESQLDATPPPELRFAITYPREASDPRELSEIPEVRLWFVRLDARYPWLPFWLDWSSGELARYTAMLVPHQFNRSEGIQYNPESLEIFVMHKVFAIADWLQTKNQSGQAKLKGFAKMLGYELADEFFTLL